MATYSPNSAAEKSIDGWREFGNGAFKGKGTRWQRQERLGSGSFGSVWKGVTDEGEYFAVKEVPLDDPGPHGRKCIDALNQEISLLSRFKHKNIVQYLGSDSDDSKLYIFLELVSPGSLRKVYETRALEDGKASAYTRQILQGLNYLHSRKVVHRDIKCANILVDAQGSAKVADFGLAKVTESNDIKSFIGTAFWMAPEVVNGKTNGYGLPADVWSLGCTVLEMSTQKIPYSDLVTTSLQALFKIGHCELPTVPEELPKDARDFIFQCLQVNPQDRPTADKLLDHPFVRRPIPTFSASAFPYNFA